MDEIVGRLLYSLGVYYDVSSSCFRYEDGSKVEVSLAWEEMTAGDKACFIEEARSRRTGRSEMANCPGGDLFNDQNKQLASSGLRYDELTMRYFTGDGVPVLTKRDWFCMTPGERQEFLARWSTPPKQETWRDRPALF